MASIQKYKARNGTVSWRVQISIHGIRDSKSFGSKAEAKLWIAQREAEIINGSTSPLVRLPASIPEIPDPSPNLDVAASKTLADVFKRYAQEVSPTKGGTRWEQVRLAKLSRYPIAQILLSELDAPHIAQWRDQRLIEVSASSVKREMTLISHSLEVARKEWRWIKNNPLRDVGRPREAPHRKQRIGEEDLQKLLEALKYIPGTVPDTLNGEVAVALLLAIETAMRSGEILGLTRRNIYLESRYVHLPKTKNGHSRDVPLSKKAIELLKLMLQKPITPDGTLFSVTPASRDALFRKAKAKTGLGHINFHDSRREATSRLAEIFTNPLELSKITGHKNLKMLLVYYDKPVSELADKLNQE